MKGVFVTGIGTGVGKTVVSAALVRGLSSRYWKPVQAGVGEETGETDSEVVARLAGVRRGADASTRVHAEAYRLKAPISPHAAARLEGVVVNVHTLTLPAGEGPIVVEGAGGVMSPVSDDLVAADLIVKFGLPAVVVSRHYLGSINHSLLSLDALRSRGVAVAGVVFVGAENRETESYIERRGGARTLGRIEEVASLTAGVVAAWGERLAKGLE